MYGALGAALWAIWFVVVNCRSLAPALIVFGDSIVDPGNNNLLATLMKCNFPPYGRDFFGGIPTGRFSNGKIPSDFIASRLGIKNNVPPYLGTILSPQDILTGVSFASGGTGFDPLTPKLASVLSMTHQLELFKEYAIKVRAIAGAERGNDILSQAIYIICCGTDDIANTYFSTPFRQTQYDISSYINMTASYAAAFLEELVNSGARRIGFLGLPPIGCVPSQRTAGGGVERECEPIRNKAAMMFNTKMEDLLQRESVKYPGRQLLFLDIYSPLLDMIQRPGSYGFVESRRGCCGTGTFEVTLLCNPLTPITCEDDSEFLFWDSYHPTERGYQILTDILLRRYANQLQ